MKNKYICDCCGIETDIDDVIFHSDYNIAICPNCYNKMEDEDEYALWYACQDCFFCTVEMVYDMFKKLKNKSK